MSWCTGSITLMLGLYFANPKSSYFSVGKIQKDQVTCPSHCFSIEKASWLFPLMMAWTLFNQDIKLDKWLTKTLYVTLFFQNYIFPPSAVQIFPFPRFSTSFQLYSQFFLNKSSYFFPNQPITHILPASSKKNMYIPPCAVCIKKAKY